MAIHQSVENTSLGNASKASQFTAAAALPPVLTVPLGFAVARDEAFSAVGVMLTAVFAYLLSSGQRLLELQDRCHSGQVQMGFQCTPHS